MASLGVVGAEVREGGRSIEFGVVGDSASNVYIHAIVVMRRISICLLLWIPR